MDNVHFNDFIHGSISDTSSVSMPQSIKNDPKLFKDDVDIRFSRTLNSCKVIANTLALLSFFLFSPSHKSIHFILFAFSTHRCSIVRKIPKFFHSFSFIFKHSYH